ncbi:MAG TPA: peroxiredoxin [Roseomonas sp.]|nr:peroxiredoxin [Roseomonas sp.]
MDPTPDLELRKRLVGIPLPRLSLVSTGGRTVDLTSLTAPRTVIYCYPRTSEPGKPAPTGWDVIPGARGCTPQACGFRDHYRELAALQAEVFGLSTQSRAYQQEMAARLHLPFPVLSDERLEFADALALPTFEVDGMRLIKRLTLIIRGSRIEDVLYPVLQPERSAREVVDWLRSHPVPAP